MEQKIKSIDIGSVVACAEYIESELSTEISIEGETLCWISWDDIDKFKEEINQVIQKYNQ